MEQLQSRVNIVCCMTVYTSCFDSLWCKTGLVIVKQTTVKIWGQLSRDSLSLFTRKASKEDMTVSQHLSTSTSVCTILVVYWANMDERLTTAFTRQSHLQHLPSLVKRSLTSARYEDFHKCHHVIRATCSWQTDFNCRSCPTFPLQSSSKYGEISSDFNYLHRRAWDEF